jgi:DNA-binding response OmpR family regulator
MVHDRKVLAFNVDWESLASLREAFPGWEVEAVASGTHGPTMKTWDPTGVDLLVIGNDRGTGETARLCRFLRQQSRWKATPLLVIAPPDMPDLVSAALEAGANTCLILPVHAKEMVSMLGRAQQGNQPGKHTTASHQPQQDDAWRDEGGEG